VAEDAADRRPNSVQNSQRGRGDGSHFSNSDRAACKLRLTPGQRENRRAMTGSIPEAGTHPVRMKGIRWKIQARL
jgi:hypothetical protein